jgi:hypothetical protein
VHIFKFETIEINRTKFRQHSKFTGLATKIIGESFVDGGMKGFQEMEKALKERAEAK